MLNPLLRGPVDLNRASAADLAALPGIGLKTAERIIQDREKKGFFLRVEDLIRVRGIGRKKLEQLRPLVVVGKGEPE